MKKIKVYNIETITPKDEDEYEYFCDILNIPSLKYGTISVIGSFSHEISKAELNKSLRASQSYYSREEKRIVNGVLLLKYNTKKFVVIE